MIMRASTAVVLAVSLFPTTVSFTVPPKTLSPEASNNGLYASDEGFDAPERTPAEIAMDTTYGTATQFTTDDSQETMTSFFETHQNFISLFTEIQGANPIASSFIGATGTSDGTKFTATERESLPDIPADDVRKNQIASFLDAMQQSLLDIPVNEGVEEDTADMIFVEEGRRILALSRFQVLDSNEALFETVWSEIATLLSDDTGGTGTLILLTNGMERKELVEFAECEVFRPLSWLGLGELFEVSPIIRSDCTGVRILYKLGEVPDLDAQNEYDDDYDPNKFIEGLDAL
uniref:TPM domain-containing protein n=1 Tax=Proboscia inermis TaxID=420281 RepID=A0A7S0CC25_9STRA|mmetsp:Transcript_38812/g.39237  ORF Transcript_38812/g.39237 Transcript_38812/m.39237 type:complete len:290 (+) Transcript_38812:25-894(+)